MDYDEHLILQGQSFQHQLFHNQDKEGSSKEWKKMGCSRSIAKNNPLNHEHLQPKKKKKTNKKQQEAFRERRHLHVCHL